MLSKQVFQEHHQKVVNFFATKNSNPPSADELKIQFCGTSTVPGYRDSFTDETWAELCGIAILECEFMPKPRWFFSRAEALTRRLAESSGGTPLMLVGAEIVPATAEEIAAAKAKVKAGIAAAKAKAKASRTQISNPDGLFVEVDEVLRPIDSFLSWVQSHRYRLYERLSPAARTGVYYMTEDDKIDLFLCRTAWVQEAFVQSPSAQASPLDEYLEELNRRVREQAKQLIGTRQAAGFLEGF